MLIDGRSDPNTAGPQTRLDIHPSASAAATTTTTATVRRLFMMDEDSRHSHFHAMGSVKVVRVEEGLRESSAQLPPAPREIQGFEDQDDRQPEQHPGQRMVK
jgi:hypothetical protein